MMPLWYEHDISVRDRHRFIKASIFGENTLEAEALRRIEAVIICLFQIGHVRKIVFVVPMGWIGRPVSLRCEYLGNKKAIGNIPAFHRNIVDETGVGAFPRCSSVRLSGPSFCALRPGLPGAVQTARTQSVVAVARQSLSAGT